MWVLALALMAAAPQAHTGVDVHAAGGGRVNVRATAAPLADVLDRLSKQVGMKVVFDGPPERQLVTATLVGRTPAEAVLGILDGLGLNYALSMDPTGKQVQTLLITGPAPASSAAPPSAPAPVAAGRSEEHQATSWDDDEGEDEPETEAEPNKAGGNPFVPQEGTNGRAVQRKEAPPEAPAHQPAAAPSPSPQNPTGEWVQPTPQPLQLPTPAPSNAPAAQGGDDDFFDDQ